MATSKSPERKVRVLKPQFGPQEKFLATPADICIGGGKTYGLLLSALRYKNVKGFGCTIFRKNYKQIFAQGGLWDEAQKMYHGINGAQRKISDGTWSFRDKDGNEVSKVSFAHIERSEELDNWQGAQICEIGFDELTHFSEEIFFYMLSRNRSTCGVRPFVRATCNPDADSWVAKFIAWWIDQDTGYPIPERSGLIRYMIRRDEVVYWADTREELWERFNLTTPEEKNEPKSVTFIMSSVYDNQELLRIDPGYLSNLKALSVIQRERLLKGRYVIADVINKQMNASDVRKTIKLTAQADRAAYKRVRIRLPKDPGQAGKEQAESYIKFLSGFDVTAVAESGSKEARAEPMAAQWQAGNFDIMYGEWNEAYLTQLENFPDGKFKDMVDASANAFAEIETKTAFNVGNLI